LSRRASHHASVRENIPGVSAATRVQPARLEEAAEALDRVVRGKPSEEVEDRRQALTYLGRLAGADLETAQTFSRGA
jgi:hypothetical protein